MNPITSGTIDGISFINPYSLSGNNQTLEEEEYVDCSLEDDQGSKKISQILVTHTDEKVNHTLSSPAFTPYENFIEVALNSLNSNESNNLSQTHANAFETESVVIESQETILNNRLKYFNTVFHDKEKKQNLFKLIDNLFLNLDHNKLDSLVTELLKKHQSYESFFNELSSRINEAAKGNFFSNIYHLFTSFYKTKEILTSQIESFFGKNPRIKNCLEYGSEGVLIQKLSGSGFDISGKKWVCNHREEFIDQLAGRIVNGFPFQLPYDQLLPIKNFEILPDSIPDSSLDMIIFAFDPFTIPSDKLSELIESFYQKLSLGGSLIINFGMEDTKSSLDVSEVGYSLFNAINAENNTLEFSEVRSFKDPKIWNEFLSSFPFKLTEKNQTKQEWNPFVGFCQFTKVAENQTRKTEEDLLADDLESFQNQLRMQKPETLSAREYTSYQALFMNHLIILAEEYSKSLNNGSIATFPFLRHLLSTWRLFFDSLIHNQAVDGLARTLISRYTLINFCMLISSTAGLIFKSLIFLPLKLKKPKDIRQINSFCMFSSIAKDYSQSVRNQSHQFYNPIPHYPFLDKISKLWSTYDWSTSGLISFNNYIVIVGTIHFLAKSMIHSIQAKFIDAKKTQELIAIVKKPSVLSDLNEELFEDEKKFEIILESDLQNYLCVKFKRNQIKDCLSEIITADLDLLSLESQEEVTLKVKTETKELDNSDFRVINEISMNPDASDQSTRYVHLATSLDQLKDVVAKFGLDNIEYIHDF